MTEDKYHEAVSLIKEQAGRHTDHVIYIRKNCRFKRGSEKSLERARKRSRTSPDPFEGCSYIWREPQCSPALAYRGPPDSTGSTSNSSGEKKESDKRKSMSGEGIEEPKKISRETPSSSENQKQTFSEHSFTQHAGTSVSISIEDEEKTSQKRKSEEDTQEPRKRSRKTPSPSEGPSHQTSTPSSTSDKPSTSVSIRTYPPNSRAAFEAKYMELTQLGKGGFGRVFNGYCKCDYMPVAIKHISQSTIKRTRMVIGNQAKMVPVEVALMLKVKPANGQTSATVTLLDWYDLKDELILVLERPLSCLDLTDYLNSRESILEESEAKIIVRQLVDAIIEVHSKGVFHRDIKLDNILIETGSDVPRVRLIDFGCGTYLTKENYTEEEGTFEYFAPEWFQRGCYTAEPTTVWQLGVVVYAMLHGYLPFSKRKDIISENPPIYDNLSSDCQGFVLSCLVKKPEARPTLEILKQHPWLM